MPFEPIEDYSTYASLNACDSCGKPCCPPGLVATKDNAGNFIGCLTASDATEYNTENASVPATCPDGYVALYKNGTPNVFLGCVASEEFAALYELVNPA